MVSLPEFMELGEIDGKTNFASILDLHDFNAKSYRKVVGITTFTSQEKR